MPFIFSENTSIKQLKVVHQRRLNDSKTIISPLQIEGTFSLQEIIFYHAYLFIEAFAANINDIIGCFVLPRGVGVFTGEQTIYIGRPKSTIYCSRAYLFDIHDLYNYKGSHHLDFIIGIKIQGLKVKSPDYSKYSTT